MKHKLPDSVYKVLDNSAPALLSVNKCTDNSKYQGISALCADNRLFQGLSCTKDTRGEVWKQGSPTRGAYKSQSPSAGLTALIVPIGLGSSFDPGVCRLVSMIR